jgi:molybdate-binding protein/transcriptional regulator with XRE-family HTH domain
MANKRQPANRVKIFRQQRGWSQEQLAQRAGISRAAVSAVEIQRLVPSVAAALALATALGCRVEDLFGAAVCGDEEKNWAWPPTQEPCRFWHARVGGRLLLFPVEATVAGVIAHDGVFRNGRCHPSGAASPECTLVMASCDPAAGLLANEFARTSGFRLLVLHRSSSQALDLLRRGLVDVAGLHLATATDKGGNALAARSALGAGYSLLKLATWEETLALGSGISASSVKSLLRSRLRWVGREPGSGARLCQDELLQDRPQPRRLAKDHRGVADAIRCGWADVGVCVRLASEEAGLRFIKLREEAYDLCFPTRLENDPRLGALLQVVRSAGFRKWLSEVPGYDCRCGGDVCPIQ